MIRFALRRIVNRVLANRANMQGSDGDQPSLNDFEYQMCELLKRFKSRTRKDKYALIKAIADNLDGSTDEALFSILHLSISDRIYLETFVMTWGYSINR